MIALAKFEVISKKAIHVIELLISIIIGLAVIINIPSLFVDIIKNIDIFAPFDYAGFGNFLKNVLSIIVGIELMLMILTHSHESILTLTLFVIARKMLVYADTMIDILLCVISIAIIFAVIKFLATDNRVLAKFDNTFSASILVQKLNREYNLKLKGEEHTLGGIVYKLAQENALEIKTDTIVEDETHVYRIMQATDGVIERVHISSKKI